MMISPTAISPHRIGKSGINWSSYCTPQNITLTVLSDTSIKVDWTNVAGSYYDGHSIERSTDGVTYVEADTVVSGTNTYTDTVTNTGTLYYYRVRAYKGSNYSEYSSEIDISDSIITMTITQPATIEQCTMNYTIATGKKVYIDWGYAPHITLTADGTSKALTSNYTTNNTTYTMKFYGQVEFITKWSIYETVPLTVSSAQYKKMTGLTELTMWPITGSHTVNSVDIAEMTALLKVTINNANAGTFNSADISDLNLTEFSFSYVSGITSATLRSIDFTTMSLTRFSISNVAGTNIINTDDFIGMPLSYFRIVVNDDDSVIKSSSFSGMTNLASWTYNGGHQTGTSVIDTGDFAICPLTELNIGHTGPDTIFDTGDLATKSLQSLYVYIDTDGSYTFDFSDLSSMTSLRTLYIDANKAGVSLDIGGAAISDLPTEITALSIIGTVTNLDITTGTMKAWAATTITMTNQNSSDDVDAFLIAWAATAGSGTKTITLKRARTSVSDAAVAILNGLGKTINTSN